MFDGGWTKDGEEGCLMTAVKVGAGTVIAVVMLVAAVKLLTALWA